MAPGPRTVVHLAPHPDDEAMGAPALLLRLRGSGWRVVNVACSLGRSHQHHRRAAEVAEACRRAGFELEVLDPPVAMSSDDDLRAAHVRLVGAIGDLLTGIDADVVVAPSPHDRHHGHEVVGRAARDVLARPGMPILWMWGLWGELPLPTLFSGFGEEEMQAAEHVLSAHAEEVARNDYLALLRGRAVAARVLGAERVFGFGSAARDAPYAELLTEAVFADGEWWAGPPRELDASRALAAIGRAQPLGWWMDAPSFTTRLAQAGPGQGAGGP